VPLLKDDSLIGYLRLSISSNRLVGLYRRARQQLLWLAIAGIACITVLGLALEVQFSRMGRTLVQAFDSATKGTKVPVRSYQPEFSEAIDAARRAGEEISVARSQTVDAEKRFGELMKVMEVGVALVSPDYALDFANESARELLGSPLPGELEQHWPSVEEHLRSSAANIGPEGGTTDVELQTGDYTTRARFEIYPREDRAGWLILVKNREKLDALENELRLAIQMRGFAHFYMAFAHDLKAPLNAMVLNLELLKRSLPEADGSDEQQQARRAKYIQTLVGEVSRLDRYLRTVLTHAAPPSQGIKKFDARELIDELGSLLSPQARHQRVNIGIDTGSTPLLLSGHRDRLKQAMLNLAINALESMPQGGELKIEAAGRDAHAAFAIRDTGPGIPPELLKEIYKMHFTTKDGGTGIGLYVARSVIQAHGGDIQVESEVGQGTCFRVTLPLSA
jgi:signal transduction histidine kinase